MGNNSRLNLLQKTLGYISDDLPSQGFVSEKEIVDWQDWDGMSTGDPIQGYRDMVDGYTRKGPPMVLASIFIASLLFVGAIERW